MKRRSLLISLVLNALLGLVLFLGWQYHRKSNLLISAATYQERIEFDRKLLARLQGQEILSLRDDLQTDIRAAQAFGDLSLQGFNSVWVPYKGTNMRRISSWIEQDRKQATQPSP